MKENSFVKVDLHIHTPASNCYEGPKDKEEYLRILRTVKSKDLKVISFTDHNSIEGYKTIIDIKNDLANEMHLAKGDLPIDPELHDIFNKISR